MNKYIKEMLVELKIFDSQFVKDPKDIDSEKVLRITGYDYIIDDKGLSQEEINTALLAKQTKFLRTIKNIALFYFWITIIGMIAYLLYLCLILA